MAPNSILVSFSVKDYFHGPESFAAYVEDKLRWFFVSCKGSYPEFLPSRAVYSEDEEGKVRLRMMDDGNREDGKQAYDGKVLMVTYKRDGGFPRGNCRYTTKLVNPPKEGDFDFFEKFEHQFTCHPETKKVQMLERAWEDLVD